MATVAEGFRKDFQMSISDFSPVELGAGVSIMGSKSAHSVMTQLLRTVPHPIDGASCSWKQGTHDGFAFLALELDRLRLAEVSEQDIDAYFSTLLNAYQLQIHAFVTGARRDSPTLSTCDPNAATAANANVTWIQRRRFDARKIKMALHEAVTSPEPSQLLNYITAQARPSKQTTPNLPPKMQPDANKKQKAKKEQERGHCGMPVARAGETSKWTSGESPQTSRDAVRRMAAAKGCVASISAAQ